MTVLDTGIAILVVMAIAVPMYLVFSYAGDLLYRWITYRQAKRAMGRELARILN